MEEIAVEKGQIGSEQGRPSSHASIPHVLIDATTAYPYKPAEETTVQRHFERVHAIDNLRNFLVAVLVFQHAVLETISRIPGDAQALFPKQYTFLDIFVQFGREVSVGMLFFVSGYGSSVSMVERSRTPQHFMMRKTIRSAVLIIAGCFGAGITTYVYGPWNTAVESQTSYYAVNLGKASLLHGPIFYLLLLFVFDSLYAFSTHFHRKTTPFITSESRYNLSKYAVMIVLEIWTICIAGGMIRPPTFLSPLIDFIHPAPQTLMQCAIGYLAGVHLSSYAEYLLAEHSSNIAPMLLRFTTRVWASTSILFSLHRRFPQLIIHFGSLKTAPKLSIPRDGTSISQDGLFVALYGLWSAVTFVLLATPIIQIFLANDRLKKNWGVVSRATTIQPFIHMILVFMFSNFAGCIGNLILRCAVVGLGAVLCGWGMVGFGLLVWDVLDGH